MAEGRYRVVYGNRRRAAAIELHMEKVPCILLDAEDTDLLLRQLIENVQRQELNDLEKARAFARLRSRIAEMHHISTEGDLDDAVGKSVGLTGRTVRRYIGLLELSQEVQQLIRRGELTVTQAQHLRRIPNKNTQVELAKAAAEEGMSAADLSRLAGYFVANPSLTLETALQALEQGVHIPDRPVFETIPESSGGPLVKTSITMVEDDDDDDLWDDDDNVNASDGEYLSVEEDTIENKPQNKARVFRIRSLDHMVDEADRISRAYAEGELEKWLQKDDSASYKLRLLLKQLDHLTHGLRTIAKRFGWDVDMD
jgi:ParB family chromosome partitioning protein